MTNILEVSNVVTFHWQKYAGTANGQTSIFHWIPLSPLYLHETSQKVSRQTFIGVFA